MEKNLQICTNCQTELPDQALYCPNCSQKNTDGRVPISIFIKDLLSNIFNVDSKVLRTAFGLIIPARLTIEYFKGRHKRFALPSRLFFVATIFFFAVFSLITQVGIPGFDNISLNGNGKAIKDDINALKGLKKYKEDLPQSQVLLVDSMIYDIQNRVDSSFMYLKLFNRDIDTLFIADFTQLSADSMITKYGIGHYADKIVFTQIYRVNKDPKSLLFSFMGNFTWTMALQIPIMVLLFKLFYIRRKHYAVEHLVYLFHVHSFLFIITGILLLIDYSMEYGLGAFIWVAWLFGYIGYLIGSLKRMYQQAWGKTLVKFGLLSMAYFFVLVLSLSVVGLVSFVLF